MSVTSFGCSCCANARLFRAVLCAPSRRAALQGFFAAAVTAATPALAQPAASQPPTVFIAKKIITMDPGWPEATAVAVQGGRIVSVGSLEDLKPWRIGSITPAKMADFAVLEADPYAVPKDAIREIAVWGTVVGGEVFPAAEIRPR